MKFVSHFMSLDKAPSQFKCRHEIRDVHQVVDSEGAGISAFHVARHLAGKAELLSGAEAASSRPVRKILLRE